MRTGAPASLAFGSSPPLSTAVSQLLRLRESSNRPLRCACSSPEKRPEGNNDTLTPTLSSAQYHLDSKRLRSLP
ncbi:hypothetical protein N658DRAFT_110902 [Parathielavia hyrcaniae]|uniref:Uncharacterized protein n=1 Tax=Parathielavia hyrcaniae TaxID=113614 RepID=A0AAN6QBE1_9PEZI|nr:hypothetical protein N658DRAFT_110902 [Parathielavia hyrcaniae]